MVEYPTSTGESMKDIFKEIEFYAYDESPTEYSDHTVSYEQQYCETCWGKIGIDFLCAKCNRQYHPSRINGMLEGEKNGK